MLPALSVNTDTLFFSVDFAPPEFPLPEAEGTAGNKKNNGSDMMNQNPGIPRKTQAVLPEIPQQKIDVPNLHQGVRQKLYTNPQNRE